MENIRVINSVIDDADCKKPPPPQRSNTVPPRFVVPAPGSQPAPPAQPAAGVAASSCRQRPRTASQNSTATRGSSDGEKKTSLYGSGDDGPFSNQTTVNDGLGLPFLWFDESDDQSGGGMNECILGASDADNDDIDSLTDELSGLASESGIFEVTLPDGEKLGVVVKIGSEQLGFLLSAANPNLGAQLQRRQMELQNRLERRTGRSVGVIVL